MVQNVLVLYLLTAKAKFGCLYLFLPHKDLLEFKL